jgi:TctA family transporter
MEHFLATENNQRVTAGGADYELKRLKGREPMLAIIAAVLLVMWLLGFTAFHVTSGFIHILLILALISLVMHLVRGKSSVA